MVFASLRIWAMTAVSNKAPVMGLPARADGISLKENNNGKNTKTKLNKFLKRSEMRPARGKTKAPKTGIATTPNNIELFIKLKNVLPTIF